MANNLFACPICGTVGVKNTFCEKCHWFLIGALDATTLSPIPQEELREINAAFQAYRAGYQRRHVPELAGPTENEQTLSARADALQKENEALVSKNEQLSSQVMALANEKMELETQRQQLTDQLTAARTLAKKWQERVAELEKNPSGKPTPEPDADPFKPGGSIPGNTSSDFQVKNGILQAYNGSDVHVKVPGGVREIGCRAFDNRTGIQTVELPNSVTTIQSYAFVGCKNLRSIDLPSSLTTIGSHAFENCPELKSVTIPGKVRQLEPYTFYECTGLQTVVLSKGLQSICSDAFGNCRSLKKLFIPNSVTKIGNRSFSGCNSLRVPELRLPPGFSGQQVLDGWPWIT